MSDPFNKPHPKGDRKSMTMFLTYLVSTAITFWLVLALKLDTWAILLIVAVPFAITFLVHDRLERHKR